MLSDRTAYEGDRRYLDPHLALAAVDLALREHLIKDGETNLRRRCGVVLRSAAIRNVHDVVVALGLGADAVCPYAMVEVSLVDDYRTDVGNLASRAAQGHREGDLHDRHPRGARLRAAVRVDRPEAGAHRRSSTRPPTWAPRTAAPASRELDADGDERQRVLAGEDESKPAKTFRFYPKVYKAAVAAANGTGEYAEYSQKVRDLEHEQPISLRHILDLKSDREADPHRAGGPRRGPAQLPDRDLVDELRLPGRDRLPRLRGGGEADQHHRDERRGRRDPGHVRQVPALARPAGGLRAASA